MGMIRQSQAERIAQRGLSLDLGDLERRAEVLREQAQHAAERIIADAKAERQRLISDAADVGRTQGFEAGLAEGRVEGEQAGRAEAIEQWSERFTVLAEQWERGLKTLEAQREQSLREAERGLLELGIAFARRVAHRAVELDPAPAATQVRAALERAATASVVRVRVHPGDMEAIRAAMPSVLDAIAGAAASDLVADDSIEPGSCVLDLAHGGSIGGTIDDQLDRLVGALMGSENGTIESAA